MFKKILIAVDGSDSNKVAVDQAIELTKTVNGTLTAICVFDIGTYGVIGQSVATGAEQELIDSTFAAALTYVRDKAKEAGISLTIKTVSGRPAEAIVAESANHDLVVSGSLGRTGVKRALMGSVAETVVRLAHCPVLVVRSN